MNNLKINLELLQLLYMCVYIHIDAYIICVYLYMYVSIICMFVIYNNM